jgi:hypothetical protein
MQRWDTTVASKIGYHIQKPGTDLDTTKTLTFMPWFKDSQLE